MLKSIELRGDDAAFLRDEGQENCPYLSHQKALMFNPVWAAVNRISGDVAKLPFRMYRRAADGKSREVADEHPTFRVIRRQPNPFMGSMRFWRTFMVHALLYNRAYAWIVRDAAGRCIRLRNLNPIQVRPRLNYTTGNWDRYLVTFANGEQVLADSSAVLDVTGMQFDGSDSIDTVEYARHNIGRGLALETFLNSFFKNGAAAGGILMAPDGATAKSNENMLTKFKAKVTGIGNAFRLVLLEGGYKYVPTTIRPIDGQVADLLSAHVKDVARWFNIPASKINGDDKGVYGSREQDARDYLDSTLQPWLTSISSQCWVKLLTGAEQDAGYYFEHDVSQLLEVDIQTKYTIGKMGIEMGVLSPDEFRAMVNLNPRPDGLGDKFYYSNNMQPAEQMEQQTEPVDESELIASAEEQLASDVKRHADLLIARLVRMREKKGKVFGNWWRSNRQSERLELETKIAGSCKTFAIATRQDPAAIVQSEVESILGHIESGEW